MVFLITGFHRMTDGREDTWLTEKCNVCGTGEDKNDRYGKGIGI